MPNEFSVEIHNYLTLKIAEAEDGIAGKDDRLCFFRGQLEELYWMRAYLKKNVDLKNFIYY